MNRIFGFLRWFLYLPKDTQYLRCGFPHLLFPFVLPCVCSYPQALHFHLFGNIIKHWSKQVTFLCNLIRHWNLTLEISKIQVHDGRNAMVMVWRRELPAASWGNWQLLDYLVSGLWPEMVQLRRGTSWSQSWTVYDNGEERDPASCPRLPFLNLWLSHFSVVNK